MVVTRLEGELVVNLRWPMAFVASAARCAGAGAAPHRFHRHCWTCCVSSCRGLIWVGAGRGLRILGWWWRLPGGAGVSAKQLSSLSLSALASSCIRCATYQLDLNRAPGVGAQARRDERFSARRKWRVGSNEIRGHTVQRERVNSAILHAPASASGSNRSLRLSPTQTWPGLQVSNCHPPAL
jgi:hypothetical protein